ncbi:MAG: YmdB family metallophosphoesterase [Oscillospiraceae bacterium]|nr:YmdB family metallophosphoesterase [Oscillospiraceae bacterium]
MIYNVLAVGDVVGRCGVEHLRRTLRPLKKMKDIHFTVVNGENAAMVGLTRDDAEDIFAAGADVITLGNHSFGKAQITPYLDECPYILRPANLGSRVAGKGFGVYDCGRVRIAVMNLIGRCDLEFNADNPFATADKLLREGEKATFTLVDFHAEATSEKLAMAYHLDGRVSALWGTHTHVPTADAQVFERGMGYVTDLGMCGAVRSVLGIRPEQSVETFLGGRPGRYAAPDGPCKMEGVIFRLDSDSGRCVGAERIDIR